MATDIQDLLAFVVVVNAGGFREGARLSGKSASSLSDAVRRMESRLGVRLLNRTTRSVVPTEAGARLMERIVPALGEVESALDVVNDFRDRPSGTLRLNVPVSAARLILPGIITPFLQAHPDIRMEVITEESFVDMLAAGCDAGIRYDDRLEQDMIAVPIGPRVQRFATAASPAYLDARGRPRASAGPADPQLPARQIPQRLRTALGIRARRRKCPCRPDRPVDRAHRRRRGSCRANRHRRPGHRLVVRRLAAPPS
jgi:DNA-binding transcriptional LysR family regulator